MAILVLIKTNGPSLPIHANAYCRCNLSKNVKLQKQGKHAFLYLIFAGKLFLARINHTGIYSHNGTTQIFFIYDLSCLCDLEIKDLSLDRVATMQVQNEEGILVGFPIGGLSCSNWC